MEINVHRELKGGVCKEGKKKGNSHYLFELFSAVKYAKYGIMRLEEVDSL